MTERKTLNRYYPVDYDPAKIPKLKGKQKEQNRLWGIRVMAPFNMRCNTCGDYIYKGKKFNSKKETVQTEDYLGIQIHRFYIRCPKCVAVIAFKTDPENCDYSLETGATRNFEAAKTLLDMEKKKQQAIEDEEAANPMKVLENRTKQSRNEMDTIEALNELREINARHEKVDHEGMIKKSHLYQKELERLQKQEEDRLIRELFGSADTEDEDMIKRIESDDEEEDDWSIPPKRIKAEETNGSASSSKPTDLLTNPESVIQEETSNKPVAVKSLPHKRPQSTKSMLSNLVKIKKPSTATSSVTKTDNSTEIIPKDSAICSNALATDSGEKTITNSDKFSPNAVVLNTEKSAANSSQSKTVGALSMLGGYTYSSDSDLDSN